MIDFHSHIIPNVDDGARNIEETFDLIKEAKKVGFEAIISTSHYFENYYEVGKNELKALIEEIAKNIYEKDMNINLYLGNEIYITQNIIDILVSHKACTINDTSYTLFELPLNVEKIPMNLYDVVYSMLENKLVPVLAHPERYNFVQKSPEIVYDLIEKGVLMQSNFGSVIGQYGKKAQIIVKNLLKNNMVHFMGSDVHRRNTIYPKIPSVLKEMEKIIGKEKLEEITSINPSLALENKKIDIPDPIQFRLTLKEKMIIKLK